MLVHVASVVCANMKLPAKVERIWLWKLIMGLPQTKLVFDYSIPSYNPSEFDWKVILFSTFGFVDPKKCPKGNIVVAAPNFPCIWSSNRMLIKCWTFFYNGMTRVWLPLATTSAPAPAPQKQKIILGIGENQIQNNIDILMQCGVMENIGWNDNVNR